MEVYPDVIEVIPAVIPYKHSSYRSVLKTEFESGVEQRRLLGNSTRRTVDINYPLMIFAKANELRRFYEARKGSFEQFIFFYPQEEEYLEEYVGVLIDSTTNFYLPSLGAQTYELSRNGVPLTETTEWEFTVGTSYTTPDSANLLITPSLGDIFHFTFTGGRLKINARFGDKPLVFVEVKKHYVATSVTLKGLEHQIEEVPLT